MKKFLTKRDIMELLCITAAKFEWCISKLKIGYVIELNQRLFAIQDLIDICHYITRKKPKVLYDTFESKINLTTNCYESRFSID